MDNIQEYDGYKFDKESVTKVTDSLSIEAPLQITINGESFTVVMQTPGNETELATGLLHAENVIKDFTLVEWQEIRNDKNQIEELQLTTTPENLADGYLSSRSLLSVSSCGICGKKEIQDLLPNAAALKQSVSFTPAQIANMFLEMRSQQSAFEITGGCHGIAAFNKEGQLLCIREDIGRHNALDKVVGHLLESRKLNEAVALTFSGRTSYEMVSKAFRAKIPIIAAVSAPSSLAIDFAKEYGLTLLGFCRANKATVYASPNRIIRPA